MNRVVITAAGVVSPIGTGLDQFREGLEGAARGVGLLAGMDASFFPTALAAEAKDNGQVIMLEHGADRKALFMERALEELWKGGLMENYEPSERILNLGAGIDYFDFPGYVSTHPKPHWTEISRRANKVVERLAARFSIGRFQTNVSTCVASTQAMGLSMRMLRRRGDQAIITGGFDSMLSHLHYMGFYKLGALSEWQGDPAGACRPFDKNRCGLVIGEGAVAYLFEDEARADKGSVLAEVAGYGSTMDAYMVTDPEPSGQSLAKAALDAIDDAGIGPADIDVVDLHGTGTFKNGPAEAKAMELIFPDRFREIPVFTLKGQIGHLIGACGAMEILGVIDMLVKQRVLPSVNCDEADPDIPLNIVRGEPRSMRIDHVLKLNAAFGGQNTALVLKKYGS